MKHFEVFLLGFMMAAVGLSCGIFGTWRPAIDPVWVLAAVVTLPLGVLLMALSVTEDR